ncbi:MAG: glycosyltransferase family 2 protein [Promethearchaeota archaeon]
MVESSPKISIIFAMLNGGKFLKRMFDSIKNLSNLKDIEVLVINNNSTDNSLQIIETYENDINIRLFNQQKGLGYAKASNIGVSNAKGEFVFITMVDVIYPVPDFFLKLLHIYNDYKKEKELIISPAIVFENKGIHYFGAKNHILGFSYTKEIKKKIPDKKIIKMTQRASGGTLFIKKNIFLDMGGFDDIFFTYYEDTDFSMRWLRKGLNIYTTNDPYLIHQHHKMRLSNEKYYFLERNRFLTFIRNIDGFKKLIPYFVICEIILIFQSFLLKKFHLRVRIYFELIKYRKSLLLMRKLARKKNKLLGYDKLSKTLDPILFGEIKFRNIYQKFLRLFNFFLKKI